MSRAAPSGAGARGGCPPGWGPPAPRAGACPRTISRTPRDGNILRQGAHTPGDGVWWRHRPQPGHTTHTPHTTKDQAHQNHIGLHAQSCPQRHAPISSMIVKNRQHQSLFESPDERQRILCAGPDHEDLPRPREHLCKRKSLQWCVDRTGLPCGCRLPCAILCESTTLARRALLLTDAAPCLAPIWPRADGLRCFAPPYGDVHQIATRVTWL